MGGKGAKVVRSFSPVENSTVFHGKPKNVEHCANLYSSHLVDDACQPSEDLEGKKFFKQVVFPLFLVKSFKALWEENNNL